MLGQPKGPLKGNSARLDQNARLEAADSARLDQNVRLEAADSACLDGSACELQTAVAFHP
jgi:hypothetical protein